MRRTPPIAVRGNRTPGGEEGKDEEGCTSTYYVTIVCDYDNDTFNPVYVTEAVVVKPSYVADRCCYWRWLVVKYYLMNISFKFHKDPSFR